VTAHSITHTKLVVATLVLVWDGWCVCFFQNMGKDPGDRLRSSMPRVKRVEYPDTALTVYSGSGLTGGPDGVARW